MRIAAAVRFLFGLNVSLFFPVIPLCCFCYQINPDCIFTYFPSKEYNKNNILGAISFSCSQSKNVQSI